MDKNMIKNDEIDHDSCIVIPCSKGKLVTFVAGKAKKEEQLERFVFAGERNAYAIHNFGQDSYFINENSQYTFIGVADGVGGWMSRNVDSGKFSYALMRAARELTVECVDYTIIEYLNPTALMAYAHHRVMEREPQAYGSSTACFFIVDKVHGYCTFSNLGDSGNIIFKADGTVINTPSQQHARNTPYQLTNPPPGAVDYFSDSYNDADALRCAIGIGDIVMIGSDGLWDNLDIVETLLSSEFPKSQYKTIAQVQEFAQKLQNKVMETSMCPYKRNYLEPYSDVKQYGAKRDDITIIICAMVEESDNSVLYY